MMIIAALAVAALLVGGAISVAVMIRDVRGLHHKGRQLTDREGDINGVSPGGAIFIGSNLTH